jgi:hypothetical protein
MKRAFFLGAQRAVSAALPLRSIHQGMANSQNSHSPTRLSLDPGQ